ncbi:MAG: 4-hydroxybenzoate octaprenyltransferase [Candidatus Paracaedibacter sp.]
MNAYIRLSRLHRPIGIVLLMLPCWWGVTLASSFTISHSLNLYFLLLFALGSLFMRGAGCTFNDLIDRNIDAKVARTKMRPLANGEISSRQALIFFGAQCLGGLGVLMALPLRCWPLSLVGLALLALYPFMKRITHWPQFILGFAFNLGVIFGAVAVAPYQELNWIAILSLYGAGIAWTMGYDTIYALQDIADDLKIGVKSTAIQFGNHVKLALSISYGIMFALLGNVGYLATGGIAYFWLMGFGVLVTMYRLYLLNPHDTNDCQKAFNANAYLGWLVWGALLTL